MRKIISLILAAMVVFSGCGAKNEAVIAKINGKEIGLSEFMVYLYGAKSSYESMGGADIWETEYEGRSIREMAMESAVDSLKIVKLSNAKAEELGVALSGDDKAAAENEAMGIYQSWGKEERKAVSLDTLAKVLIEKKTMGLVYDKVTEGYTADEAAYRSYLDENAEEYKDAYTLMSVRMILIEDEDEAYEALSRARAGEDFGTLAARYEKNKNEITADAQSVYKSVLENHFGTDMDLGPGDISDVIKTDDGYYIVKAESVTPLTDEEAGQDLLANYTSSMKDSIFKQVYDGWLAAAQAEINDEEISKVRI